MFRVSAFGHEWAHRPARVDLRTSLTEKTNAQLQQNQKSAASDWEAEELIDFNIVGQSNWVHPWRWTTEVNLLADSHVEQVIREYVFCGQNCAIRSV